MSEKSGELEPIHAMGGLSERSNWMAPLLFQRAECMYPLELLPVIPSQRSSVPTLYSALAFPVARKHCGAFFEELRSTE